MGALPKKKHTRARTGNRRAHMRINIPSIGLCPQCRGPRLSHRACPRCGYYNGREVMPPKTGNRAE